MKGPLIDRKLVETFLVRLDTIFARPGKVFLCGETTHVVEGWRRWTPHVEFASSVRKDDRAVFNESVRTLAAEMDIPVTDEFPGEVIPLPAGYEERARSLSRPVETSELNVHHFDPYSIAFRYIARGLEHDYELVLTLLLNNWIDVDEMERLLEGLLPSFSMDTIQQDAAEFRRRHSGLMQMYRSRSNGAGFTSAGAVTAAKTVAGDTEVDAPSWASSAWEG